MERNGIEVEHLTAVIGAMQEHPELATVKVCTRHRWDAGFAVDGQIEKLEEAGEAVTRRHTFRTDWPEPFGRDSGPTPGAESMLSAVGACIATTYVAKAALHGVPIDELEVNVEGQLDLRGLFEAGSVPPGFSEIRVSVNVHSSADKAVLEQLGRLAARTSPACDVLTRPVPVQLTVEHLR